MNIQFYPSKHYSSWYISLAFEKLKQEDFKFKANLGYKARLCLKNKTTTIKINNKNKSTG